MTFDDITELLSAQRKAAWADVARRIAHEIKNPLTPDPALGRAAEAQIPQGDHAAIPRPSSICTETIVRQVGDIGRMVDEFSSFARMPAPVMRPEDLDELVRQAVFLQRNAHPEIDVRDRAAAAAGARVPCDARPVGQALTNLLQNAVDAIERPQPTRTAARCRRARVDRRALAADGDAVAIAVEDNGKRPADATIATA